MATDDFFRARIDQMIDLSRPLAVLARRMPWGELEKTLAPVFAHRDRQGRVTQQPGLFGPSLEVAGAGVSNAGRPRLPIRLMVSLLYLKHAFNLSDEALVERWSENVLWQYFSGREYYEHRPPCDATQIGRFRKALGEAGAEELLKTTIEAAVAMKAIRPAEFERVIVDSTVQPKAIAYPVDARLLEIARHQVVKAAKAAGIALKQTFAREGGQLRRKAGGYAHARQFKRMRKVLRRQRTVLGRLIREVQRKLPGVGEISEKLLHKLETVLERADILHRQKPKGKNKLYAMHAPEVECISKGKARQRYEFGVKTSIVCTHRQGLVVGARTFAGNPYDGHVLNAQLEQTGILLQDVGRRPREVIVDLGYRGVDQDNPDVKILHRGRSKSMTKRQRKWVRRRQAIEPLIGHLKADHRLDRCWLKGAEGDALHAVLCAAGYNLRWLLRAVARLGLEWFFALCALLQGLLLSVAIRRPGPAALPTCC